jgi:uncharacterized protein YuzE
MIDMSYDPEADAAYIYLARGKIDRQEIIGDFVADVDADGRILGLEILFASKVLAPGDWQKARRPGTQRIDAAE